MLQEQDEINVVPKACALLYLMERRRHLRKEGVRGDFEMIWNSSATMVESEVNAIDVGGDRRL